MGGCALLALLWVSLSAGGQSGPSADPSGASRAAPPAAKADAGAVKADAGSEKPAAGGKADAPKDVAAGRSLDARQVRLEADTARLYELAQELKAEVDKSSKDMMSVAVIKKAAEVERLAHDLRELIKVEAPKAR